MKKAISASIIVFIIVTFIISEFIFTKNTFNTVEYITQNIYDASITDTNENYISQQIEDLNNFWNKRQTLLSIFISYKDFAQFEECLTNLTIYSKLNKNEDVSIYSYKILSYIEKFSNIYYFNFANIF